MELGQAYEEALTEAQRHALMEAAQELIDTTLMDLSASDRPDWTADNWLMGTMLPPRYRLRYTADFARRFFVCLITVIWKLGQREQMRPSCLAEELAAHILLQEAEALAEERDEPLNFDGFRDAFFEDLDFEFLYEETFDGIERTDVAEAMGITRLPFGEWFERFGPPRSSTYTEVHPYAQASGDSPIDTSSV